MTDEFDHIRPHSQVHLALMPGDAYLVLETPAEVKEKILAVMPNGDEDRMGIELGGGEEEASEKRLVTLTAVDLWGMPDGTMEVELFELTTFAMISVYRGISKRWWEDHIRRNQQGGGAPGVPPFAVIGGGGIAEVFSLGPSVPMKVAERQEFAELDCCCGHPAAKHTDDDEFVGKCGEGDCRCRRFHTHR